MWPFFIEENQPVLTYYSQKVFSIRYLLEIAMIEEKILAMVGKYIAELEGINIPVKRMDTSRKARDLSLNERLMHAHYLCKNVQKFIRDPESRDKGIMHFGFMQACLSFGGLYSIDDFRKVSPLRPE